MSSCMLESQRKRLLHLGKDLLELRLRLKLLECINLFCNVDVVAVGDVALIGDAWDNTKARR